MSPSERTSASGYCVVFDTRLVPEQDPEEAWSQARALLESLQADDPDFKYAIEVWDRRPGYRISRDELVVKAVASAYEEMTGHPIGYGGGLGSNIAAIGTADTHYLAYEGIPCVNAAGPAPREWVAHAANERLPIETLVKNSQAVALTILRYFGL